MKYPIPSNKPVVDKPTDQAATLCKILRKIPGLAGLTAEIIKPVEAFGLSHDHFHLGNFRLKPDEAIPALLRIPRLNQSGLDPQTALTRQVTAFQRMAECGRTPLFLAHLPLSRALPRGALIVQDLTVESQNPLTGKATCLPQLPNDMPRLAEALVRLHTLTTPTKPDRSPLPDLSDVSDFQTGPLADIKRNLDAICTSSELSKETYSAFQAEWHWLARFATAKLPCEKTAPILVDAHPGNFLIQTQSPGFAYMVDLEKIAYGNPAIDLAHATLYPSCAWDPRCGAVLSPEVVRDFYNHYLNYLPASDRDQLRPWLIPMRRLVWLRSSCFFAIWRQRRRTSHNIWHARSLPPALEGRINSHIDACLAPERVVAIRAEWIESGAAILE